MALKLALIGSTMAVVGYTTYKYMAKPNPSKTKRSILHVVFSSSSSSGIFTEKSFFQEALILAQGYKPIQEKLVEPIQPLKIDTSNSFNTLTLLSAQVEIPIRGALRSGSVYCYATRESLDDEFVSFLCLFQRKTLQKFSSDGASIN